MGETIRNGEAKMSKAIPRLEEAMQNIKSMFLLRKASYFGLIGIPAMIEFLGDFAIAESKGNVHLEKWLFSLIPIGSLWERIK